MIRKTVAVLLAVLMSVGPAAANWCALPGRNGTANLSSVINTYFPGTASASAGATSIRLGASRGAAQVISAGDLLLVIQMQDATINTSNDTRYGDGVTGGYGNGYTAIRQSGVYEYVRATNSVGSSGGTLTIQGATGGGLVNSYNYASASTTPRRTFQVVRVPQYIDAAISGTVTAPAWNGSTGGVVAIDVARRLTFSGGTVSAAGLGFRGGAGANLGGGSGSNTAYRFAWDSGWGASKGEGVAGTPRFVFQDGARIDNGVEGYASGSYGRGAPGNAGGGGNDGNPSFNEQNTGGGGGGNGGDGGRGGHAWCPTGPEGCAQTGGHPGSIVDEIGVGRVVMGGGGGAGTNNNETGSPSEGLGSSGAAGGGIVFIRAGEIAGTGTITVNGANGNSTAQNDASGGGGAGGSVLLSSVRQISGTALSVSAHGGNGGSNTGGGTAHGPGGGGGGGFIASSFSVFTDVSGGSAGTTVNGGSFGIRYGASGGNGGAGIAIIGADIPGLSSGGECTPIVTKAFPDGPTSPGVPTPLQVTVTNNNPTQALTALTFTDTYPSGLVNAAAPSPMKSCSTAATLTAAAGGNSFKVSNGIVPAGSSCIYSANVVVNDYAARTNSIAAGDVTGAYNIAVETRDAASATLTVSPPLTIAKASTPYLDPVRGTNNPKNIPGTFIAYTISVANPAPYTVTGNSIVITDATPANLDLYVGNLPGMSAPILFLQGSPSSGLTFTFSGLSSTTDDVDFSNNGGTSWTYTPVPDSSGVDPAVTHIRVRPKGGMAPGSSFSLMLGYLLQ